MSRFQEWVSAVNRPAVGSVASAGARRDDTVGASRRVGRADVSISWPAVFGTGFSVSRRLGLRNGRGRGRRYVSTFRGVAAQGGRRFYVSRRGVRKAGYVSTFRGDVAAACDRREVSGEADRPGAGSDSALGPRVRRHGREARGWAGLAFV